MVRNPSPPAPGSRPPSSINAWDPRLLLDLAIGVDPLEEILLRYDLTEEAYNRLCTVESFRRELAIVIREAREEGVAFTRKAKIQAESYLLVLDDMVYDPATPASVRLESIRSAVRWGKLEPDTKAAASGGPGQNNIQININF